MEKSREVVWSDGRQNESSMVDAWLLGRIGQGKDEEDRMNINHIMQALIRLGRYFQ